MGTQQFDPEYQYQARKFGQQRPMCPLNTGLPPYGEQYAYSPYSPYSGGPSYVNILQYSGQPRIRVCQWQPTMPVQPRLVYPTQPMQTLLAIPTTLVVTIVPQSQVQTVASQLVQTGPSTSQPQVSSQEVQVSQVVVQQPLISGVQQQLQVSIPLSGLTQA